MDQPDLDRKPDETGDITDLQPLHQLGTMRLNRFGAEAQPEGNLFGRVAFGNELENFPLTRAEPIERIERTGPFMLIGLNRIPRH